MLLTADDGKHVAGETLHILSWVYGACRLSLFYVDVEMFATLHCIFLLGGAEGRPSARGAGRIFLIIKRCLFKTRASLRCIVAMNLESRTVFVNTN